MIVEILCAAVHGYRTVTKGYKWAMVPESTATVPFGQLPQ